MPVLCRHDVQRLEIRPVATAYASPLYAASLGLEVSRGRLPQDVIIQSHISHQLFGPGIFLLQGAQLLGLVHSQATILLAPAVISLFADAKLLSNLRDLLSPRQFNLCFAQLRDDLFCCESFPRHSDLLYVFQAIS